jgi:hypothetical protein
MSEGFRERVLATGEDGAALSNTVSATSLLPAGRKFTLPSYFFDRVGKSVLVRAAGRISTVVTTPGTLKLDLRLGAITVFSSGLMSLNTTAQTNVGWLYEAELVCRSIGTGTSATLFGQGKWHSHAVIAAPAPASGGAAAHVLPFAAAPAAGSGFDSTAAQTIDFIATWSVANAANSLTLHQFSVDVYS